MKKIFDLNNNNQPVADFPNLSQAFANQEIEDNFYSSCSEGDDSPTDITEFFEGGLFPPSSQSQFNSESLRELADDYVEDHHDPPLSSQQQTEPQIFSSQEESSFDACGDIFEIESKNHGQDSENSEPRQTEKHPPLQWCPRCQSNFANNRCIQCILLAKSPALKNLDNVLSNETLCNFFELGSDSWTTRDALCVIAFRETLVRVFRAINRSTQKVNCRDLRFLFQVQEQMLVLSLHAPHAQQFDKLLFQAALKATHDQLAKKLKKLFPSQLVSVDLKDDIIFLILQYQDDFDSSRVASAIHKVSYELFLINPQTKTQIFINQELVFGSPENLEAVPHALSFHFQTPFESALSTSKNATISTAIYAAIDSPLSLADVCTATFFVFENGSPASPIHMRMLDPALSDVSWSSLGISFWQPLIFQNNSICVPLYAPNEISLRNVVIVLHFYGPELKPSQCGFPFFGQLLRNVFRKLVASHSAVLAPKSHAAISKYCPSIASSLFEIVTRSQNAELREFWDLHFGTGENSRVVCQEKLIENAKKNLETKK